LPVLFHPPAPDRTLAFLIARVADKTTRG
jgi:hypothetical protein